MIVPLYWNVQTDTSNSFQLFSNALGNKGWKNIIHVSYGWIYIGKEHKNSSYKTFVNNIRCYGTKHEKTQNYVDFDGWSVEFEVMFSCLWSREHVIQREFIWNWQLINRKNKNNAEILVSNQFHTLVTGRLNMKSRFGFRQRRRFCLICRDGLLSPFATLKLLCGSVCDTSKESVQYDA